ncbi:ABC transporter-like protein [Apilactobacillus ozensis DSM 23829 = JCM 17196]|uniref:UvrABC system protein A n=1 Tax=Apilactobacillus ozensis DSM 23829 = JCM 17196 TaxID=1423781 RepID=A0A0R2ALS0_9LACO|nr:excinuclease ABC subunit UvrA [Apilactobacillus ozensis]KRM67917.1 ABC transporter-like protein [Apilactobacillus ozensis DSM 23829 = JCM 17196]
MTNDFIHIKDAHQNNLKDISLKIPKHLITVFTGLSGSGKSSLVFDTLAANSRRELNETFPSFTQQYLPKYGAPHVGNIENLPVAIVIQQKKVGKNPRSTLSTYTGIYSLLRLLFSRIGKPWVGYSDAFSFNLPQGMCDECQGLGYVDEIKPEKILDYNKSLNEGAITFVSFGPNTWRWKRYAYTGLFDNDKPLKEYSDHELNMLLYAPQQKLKNAPKQWKNSILYEGLIPRIKRSILESREGQHHKKAIANTVTRKICPKCHGKKLKDDILKCKINNYNIADVLQMNLAKVLLFLDSIKNSLALEVIRELKAKLQSLIDLGLDYLTLDRSTDTLSGGEVQRIKIAKFMNSSLVDMLYILDEPSVGLHPKDIELIKKALFKLRDSGNTVVIVEHNPELIPVADYVFEIGPGAGKDGGEVTFSGTYDEMFKSDTITGKMLRNKLTFKDTKKHSEFLKIRDAQVHNLHSVSVDIPMNAETVISGVAGSGKSSLVNSIKKHLSSDYVDLSQDSVGVNIRATSATYLNILDSIRKLFSNANGKVSRSLFSYNGKGKCPMCKGKGVNITNMAFMDPVIQVCERCHGKRYNDEALSYLYNGKNISEVLNMSISDAHDFFENNDEIVAKLSNMQKVGLGYLSLGQSLDTLSGGEVQRLKLANQLNNKGTVYILDEPTAGLHMQDVKRIEKLFSELVNDGNTLIVVEHNVEIISKADWMIDVGPGAGINGGHILYQGIPEQSTLDEKSITGKYLKKYNM